jgi:two-component system, NarL family, response regulator DegU
MEARVPDSNEPDRRLTPRERQVVQQAALGMSNRQIGEELEIAEQTVKNHLSSAMRKLSIRDRTSAVVVALGQGLISVPVVPAQGATFDGESVVAQLPERATKTTPG